MIISKQNTLIKEIKSLFDKKNRDESGLYLAEGTKLVRDAIFCGAKIKVIVGTQQGLDFLGRTDFKTEVLSDQVFDYISSEKTPQGVIAVIYKPQIELCSPTKSCLLLDGVLDPSNVGAIIRCAAASGYNEVYLTQGSADAFNIKAVRSSMGGVFRVKMFFAKREELVDIIDCPFISADMNGENVFKFVPPQKFCLCIGSEGQGLSEIIRKKSKYTISIPMENGVESLNASVSAGILMYALKK